MSTNMDKKRKRSFKQLNDSDTLVDTGKTRRTSYLPKKPRGSSMVAARGSINGNSGLSRSGKSVSGSSSRKKNTSGSESSLCKSPLRSAQKISHPIKDARSNRSSKVKETVGSELHEDDSSSPDMDETFYPQESEYSEVDDSSSTDLEELSIPLNPIEEAHSLINDLVGDWDAFKQNYLGVDVKKFANVMEKEWFSLERFFNIFKKNYVRYDDDLNVVSFSEGTRKNVEFIPSSNANFVEIMNFLRDGCSLRITQPHKYDSDLAWKLQLLQEIFECVVGCNAYFTPRGTQGFAPHFDDIDAFVLQISGCKHWKVYKPKHPLEKHSRFSSPDYAVEDLQDYTKVFDEVLQTGDILYMPRGYLHQAESPDTSDSLHLTISVFQRTTFADVYFGAVQKSVCSQIDNHPSLRKNLSLGTFCNLMELGIVVPTMQKDNKKGSFTRTHMSGADSFEIRRQHYDSLSSVLDKYLQKINLLEEDILEALGDLTMRRIKESMPLSLHPSELRHHMLEAYVVVTKFTLIRLCRWSTVYARPTALTNDEDEEEHDAVKTSALDRLRTSRKKADKSDRYNIYSTVNNSWEAIVEPSYVTVDKPGIRVLEYLFMNYPDSVSVDSLPGDDENYKIECAQEFFNHGLIIAMDGKRVSEFHGEDFEEVGVSSASHGSGDSSVRRNVSRRETGEGSVSYDSVDHEDEDQTNSDEDATVESSDDSGGSSDQ